MAQEVGRFRRSGATLLLLFLVAFFAPVAAAPATVDLNRATQKELSTLPFIGESRAAAIVRYRRSHGPFTHLNDLQKVPGIGAKTVAAITPLVTINGRAAPAASAAASPADQPLHIRTGQIMLLADDAYYPQLRRFINGARHRIDMVMYLFKSGKSRTNRANQIARALVMARKRGVKVQVVLEKSNWNDSVNSENRKIARYLRHHGVGVRFDSLATTTHSKVVVIDQRFCFVGSHNLTHSALARNHEMSILFDSPKVARQMQNYIERLR